MKRAHIFVSGSVQGVWFRASTREKAESLLLNGWVRNLPDGRVETVFEGDDEKVEEMVEWCRHGPPLSRVDKVAVTYEMPEGEKEFAIRY